MFGKRPDGVKVKNQQIIEKAMPYFMPMRIDAVNLFEQVINCENIDKFIKQQKDKNGVHYSYTEILMAACVRMLYERPKTNRFINNCIAYQRKEINVSMSIMQALTDDADEITLKMPFTGRESIDQVKSRFNGEVEKNLAKDAEMHKTTKAASVLDKMPGWMFKFALWIVRFLDKHNMLSKKLIDCSPFHTSIYITDLRSIKLDAVYHHLYNFGNTSIFAALGKAVFEPVADKDGNIKMEKHLHLKLSLDERIADGLYFGRSVKLLMKYIENPELLLEELPEKDENGKILKKKKKQEKKAAKVAAKSAKKAAKSKKKTKKQPCSKKIDAKI